jgi:hypothetical protein
VAKITGSPFSLTDFMMAAATRIVFMSVSVSFAFPSHQMKPNASDRASTASAFDFTWF